MVSKVNLYCPVSILDDSRLYFQADYIPSDNTWILSISRMKVNVGQCPFLDSVPTLLERVVGVLSAI